MKQTITVKKTQKNDTQTTQTLVSITLQTACAARGVTLNIMAHQAIHRALSPTARPDVVRLRRHAENRI